MTTVITYGTFDLFHIGHLRLLERISHLGTRVVVGVSTDEFNLVKGKRTLIPFEDRLEIVRSIRYVDETFAEDSWDQKRADILRFSADMLVMGDDWLGRFDHLNSLCEVVYLSRTQGVSSTSLRSGLAPITGTSLALVKDALDLVAEFVHRLE